MSQSIQYDPSEPKHVPIVVSILLTILIILIMTFGIIYLFKGILTQQITKNENNYGKGYELTQLIEYENTFLNSQNSDKITIDDAITITINQYR